MNPYGAAFALMGLAVAGLAIGAAHFLNGDKDESTLFTETEDGRVVCRKNGEVQWDIAKPVFIRGQYGTSDNYIEVRWMETGILNIDDHAIVERRAEHLREWMETVDVDDTTKVGSYISDFEVVGDAETKEWVSRFYFNDTRLRAFICPYFASKEKIADAMNAFKNALT